MQNFYVILDYEKSAFALSGAYTLFEVMFPVPFQVSTIIPEALVKFSEGLSGGEIAGIVIGVIGGILIMWGTYFGIRYLKNKKKAGLVETKKGEEPSGSEFFKNDQI